MGTVHYLRKVITVSAADLWSLRLERDRRLKCEQSDLESLGADELTSPFTKITTPINREDELKS